LGELTVLRQKIADHQIKGGEMSESNYEVKNVEPVVVSNDIQVRVFTLAQGNVIPWHYHRESTDHYFVLQGALTIETRSPDDRRVLTVGERYKILPGHRALHFE
jgi:quercetin dioxygenase-like cupin family protein